FEAENPGVKVHVTVTAWNQIGLAVLKAAQAGRTADITMSNSGEIQRQIAAGALMPLDAFLAKLDKTNRDDLIILSSAIKDGNHHGIPYDIRVYGFHYRGDLLEKAGLKVP